MLELEKSKDKFIIKQNSPIFVVGVFACVMAIPVVSLLFNILFFQAEYTAADYFGVAFLCVWLFVTLGGALHAFSESGKQIVIDNEGVSSKSFLSKKYSKWTDIKDWGLSYQGQTRGHGNTYYLYFSENVYPVKNECRKKLKGKMIYITIIEDDYYRAVNHIIEFCRDKTEVEPFVAVSKHHFI